MRTLLVPPEDVLAALKTSELVASLRTQSNAIIEVLCHEPAKALFECMAGVDAVHCYSGENHLSVLRSQLLMARQLRRQSFDQIMVLREQSRWPALAMAMGSRLVPVQLQPRCVAKPILLAPNIDSRYIRRKFGVSALMPMVMFHQQEGSIHTNDWPTRYWVELINLLAEAGPYQAVFVGSTAQRAKATEICAITNLTTPSHNLCGLTSLRDILGLIACAKVVVGTTALHHQLSACLNTKTVDMNQAPLTQAATPGDLIQAIESVLSNGRESDNASGNTSSVV
jgi:ADP-heptose:LPS heptosyltransferase